MFNKNKAWLIVPATVGALALASCDKTQDYEDPTADGIRVGAAPASEINAADGVPAVDIRNAPACRNDADVSILGGRGAKINGKDAVVLDFQDCPGTTVIHRRNVTNIDALTLVLPQEPQPTPEQAPKQEKPAGSDSGLDDL